MAHTEVKCPDCGNSLVPENVLAKNKEVEQAKKKREELLRKDEKKEESKQTKQMKSKCSVNRVIASVSEAISETATALSLLAMTTWSTLHRIFTMKKEMLPKSKLKNVMNDAWQAFAFPFKEERGIAKIAIGGFLSIIPILCFWSYGYLLCFLQRTITGKSKKMPEWTSWGKFFSQGFFCWIILVLCMFFVFMIFLMFFLIFERLVTPVIGSIVVNLSWLIFFLLLPMIFCKYAHTSNFASAFNIKVIIKNIRSVGKDYFIRWLIVIVSLCLIGIPSFMLCLAVSGMLFSLFIFQIPLFYLSLVAVKLFGEIYPTDGSEENTNVEK